MYAINSFNSHQDVILLSFIAIGLQLYTIFNTTRVSFLSHIVERPLRRVSLALEPPLCWQQRFAR